MATCPSGHQSADDEFCDVCGFAIDPAAVPLPIPAAVNSAVPAGVGLAATPTVIAVPCPHCGAP
jgi:hypothetical protein